MVFVAVILVLLVAGLVLEKLDYVDVLKFLLVCAFIFGLAYYLRAGRITYAIILLLLDCYLLFRLDLHDFGSRYRR